MNIELNIKLEDNNCSDFLILIFLRPKGNEIRKNI